MPDAQATGFDAKPAAASALVVGQIESAVGVCSLTRPGGDPFQVKHGDPVCRGDILETTAGGKIGIRFIDGTAFNLSDSARVVVKEFGFDGAEPSALFDISRGTFAFIAGEMAKRGRLGIETPFASIRGRAQSGGIGMLSLASLFFAALENAQGSTTLTTILHGVEDGEINIRDSSDVINAAFGIIELRVGSQTFFIDDPFSEYIVRQGSVSQVPLTQAQLQQFLIASQNVQSIASLGQGPTVGGPSGSSDTPPSGPPPFVTPINNPGPTGPSGPTSGPGGGGGGSGGAGPDIFIPPPPPPPPPPAGSFAINEKFDTTGSPDLNETSGSLPASILSLSNPSFVWSGGSLTDDQKNALMAAGTPPSPGDTEFKYKIIDSVLDFIAVGETLKVTFQATFTDGTTQPVTVTVFGTNDGPVIDASTNPGDIIEIVGDSHAQDIPQVNGTITVTDADINDALTFTVLGNATASYKPTGGACGPSPLENSVNVAALIASGAITFDPVASNGQQQTVNWHYNPNAADLDWLRQGDTLTLIFTVRLRTITAVSTRRTW